MILSSQVAEPQCIIWVRINSASIAVAQHQLAIYKAVTHNFSSVQLCWKKKNLKLSHILKKFLWEFCLKKLEENSFCELPVVCDLTSRQPSWESHISLQKSHESNAIYKNFPGNEVQVGKKRKSEHLWIWGSHVGSCSFCPNYTVVFNSWKGNKKPVFKAIFFLVRKRKFEQ